MVSYYTATRGIMGFIIPEGTLMRPEECRPLGRGLSIKTLGGTTIIPKAQIILAVKTVSKTLDSNGTVKKKEVLENLP